MSPAPLSRRAGVAAGRWWRRYGPGVARASQPARKAMSTGAAYGWFVAYMWIGLLLSVAAQRITGVTSPLVLIAAVGGGCALGYWQARHRMLRHADPSTPPLRRTGLALVAWLGAIGIAMLVTGG
jgi:hypothetical protein